MKLEPGMLIQVDCCSEPYRVKHVKRGCTCRSYVDDLNGTNLSTQAPHIHITCSRADGTGEFYINRWSENTLLSLDKTYCGHKTELDYNRITILDDDQHVQMALF